MLCEDIGPRLSGTAADEKSVEYMAAHFRACGAQVDVQDYPCPGWDHESTELLLGGESLPAFAQAFSSACDVEAEIAAVATRDDLDLTPDLEGKVILLHGPEATKLAMDRNPTLLAVEERRPAALLVVSSTEPVPSKLIRDPALRVPAAAVPLSVGERLRESEGSKVRLRIRARRYPSTGHNVIGHLPGKGEGRIVVGAHYDTAAECPGAFDDGSGTAVVLELCELFAGIADRHLGIDFVAFGAEEYGRHIRALGSVEYVRRRTEAMAQTQATVQIDGAGHPACQFRAHVMGWPPDERDAIFGVLEGLPFCVPDEEPATGSDHVPFYLLGIPAVAFMSDYHGVHIHTPEDTLSLLAPAALAQAAAAAAAVVCHLACKP